MNLAALTLILSSALASTPPVPASAKSYAVIVATNTAYESTLTPLQYADDDGARYYELFSLATSKIDILSVFDARTQTVFPEIAAKTKVPRRENVLSSLDATFEAIRNDNKQGIQTNFYFIYVGHGSLGEDGEGSMHFLDSRFTRSDLFQQVISKSPASFNHVIIDACNAYLMVSRRGDSSDANLRAQNAVNAFLSRESLSSFPNTGVLVSTSKASEVHEWSRFEAGVFSHEVRSALAGAADVNLDGNITYPEVQAFVSAANAQVRNPKAKLDAFAMAPSMYLHAPLFSTKLLSATTRLVIPPKMAGKYYLEDERGVRFADFNMSAEGPVTMTLVPSGRYFLRDSEDQELLLPVDSLASIDASQYKFQPVSSTYRGSEALTFQRDLFAIPFGRSYFEGYRASAQEAPSPPMTQSIEPTDTASWRPLTTSLAVSGVLALAAGVTFGVMSARTADEFRVNLGSSSEISDLESQSLQQARVANGLYVTGGTLLLGSLLSWTTSSY